VVGPLSGADKDKDIYIYSFSKTLFASDPSLDDKNKKQKVSEDNFEKKGSDYRKPSPRGYGDLAHPCNQSFLAHHKLCDLNNKKGWERINFPIKMLTVLIRLRQLCK
jgi:hypothetical protein